VVHSNPTRPRVSSKNLLAEEQTPMANLPSKIDFNSSKLLDSWGDSQFLLEMDRRNEVA